MDPEFSPARPPGGAGTVLLVIGRNDWRRSSLVFERVVDELARTGMPVLRYESRTKVTRRLLEQGSERIVAALPAFLARRLPGRLLTRLARNVVLLLHPGRWDYVVGRRRELHHASPSALRRFIGRVGARRVVLLTHSAGGIAGAMAESAPAVLCHVCFGYPFQHPERPPEARRTLPLERLAKPMLIVQGERDDYGTAAEARQRWPLSPAITLHAVVDDHHYDALGEAEVQALLHTITAFIDQAPAPGARRPPENPG